MRQQADRVRRIGVLFANYSQTDREGQAHLAAFLEPAFGLEIALLFGGMWLYLRSTVANDNIGRYGMLIFGPPPVSDTAAAATAPVLYFGFAAIVYWLEGRRS